MRVPSMTLHPSFDTLSAFADARDAASANTRVGRHVARCAECRSIVADIRALGDAARAMTVEGAPPELWQRIAASYETDTEVGNAHALSDRQLSEVCDDVAPPMADRSGSPADVSSRGATKIRSITIGGSVIGLLLVAATLLPSRAPLEATGLS
jgi:hypothetical protein